MGNSVDNKGSALIGGRDSRAGIDPVLARDVALKPTGWQVFSLQHDQKLKYVTGIEQVCL